MSDQDHTYPLIILPHEDYVHNIPVGVISAESHDLIIQRRAPQGYSEPEISPDIFDISTLPGMSVNLLGGLFEPIHVKWCPKNVKNWPCEETFSGEYEYFENTISTYIHVSKIHNATFPSSRSFPDRSQFDKYKSAIVDAFSNFSSKQTYPVSYRISVEHRPTNANYWHCQVEISPDMDTDYSPILQAKSSWQKNAFRALANFLLPYASKICPETSAIPVVEKDQYFVK